MSKSRLLEIILWLIVNQILFMEIYLLLGSYFGDIQHKPSTLGMKMTLNDSATTLKKYDRAYYCSLYPTECNTVRRGIYKYSNDPVFVTLENNSLVMRNISRCHIPSVLLSSTIALDHPLPPASSTSCPPLSVNVNKILIIFTTCNHLSHSVLSLASISCNDPSTYDLLVIDDHSTDGTVAYLKKHVHTSTLF